MLYGYGSSAIKCTIFDSFGNMGIPSKEVKREELVSIQGLLPRDLRKIEKSKGNDLVPSLVTRRKSILISLLTVKALIKPDMVILFDSIGNGITLNSRANNSFIRDMQLRLKNQTDSSGLKQDPLPYEFRALEAIFISALSNLTSEMKVLLTVSQGILQDLENNITRDRLRFLLVQNKKLSIFCKKATLVREMIDDLLEQDDILCSMYLTDNNFGKARTEDDHTEIEMLLETYHNHIDEIVQKSENAISNVKTTEEIINIILDSNRNQLMLLGLRFSLSMLSMGIVLYVGSIYGMNLNNFIEESSYGFASTAILSTLCMIWIYARGIKRLHSLQKMSLLDNTKINKSLLAKLK
ncbi:Mfm1p NDAI_0E02880 [Naumovozyma dairenensis CBS 421]|uniref:Magnesium transporter n=1 Tax=Naumovozyma dairenensis (strain ATCC 10597 / BCRC 20456 / CBS 421 / NBRC 0211 / NRRL Y-12639) TaxID=1071378 RepID=G0WBI5_NAUDC|nr:hypothetical protein NDAI_0E02880 [Naumovozyma dairenensis CBS 421]CCD25105.1 hypothetical protein NDAI_0E02880 [Naumovozyma dairenensis CBS 421]